ncbi:MAG: transcriptional regulator BetI [Pseudomonadota bacterium]
MANSARTRKRSEDRREDLIKATLEAVGEAYSLEVTVGEIAQRAGVSSALAHHYFGGKDDLFLAAMRSLMTAFRQDVVARLRACRTARDRLSAIVRASFAPQQFAPSTVAAWVIFYARSGSSPRFARLLRIYVRRLRANLMHELKNCAVLEDPESAAEAIGAMIDGLYLRQGLRHAPPDPDKCIAITEAVIDDLLARGRSTVRPTA